MFKFIINIFRTKELLKTIEIQKSDVEYFQWENKALQLRNEELIQYVEKKQDELEASKKQWEETKKREDADRDHKWTQQKEKRELELSKMKLDTEIECAKMKTDTAKECQAEVELNCTKINGFWERAVAFAANGSDKMLNRFMEFVMADKTVQSDFIIQAREAALLESGKTEDTVAAVIEKGWKKKK